MQDYAAFQDEVPAIVKNKGVKDRGGKEMYKFAEFDQVYKQLKPALKNHNIRPTWESAPMEDGSGRTMVTCCLHHLPSGHEKTYSVAGIPDTSGGKNSIQGTGSTDSYLRRYSLLGACDLISEGEDTDGLAQSKTTYVDNEQIAHMQSLIEKSGRGVESFCNWAKVKSLSEITNERYGAAVNMLNAIIKNAGVK